MRLHYRSLTRPKHVARRMQTIFPALGLVSAQNWTARMMGYRDWHELHRAVASYAGDETPDIHIPMTREGVSNQDEVTTLIRRQKDQEKVLLELVGDDLVDMPSLFYAVDPNVGGFPFRKLGATGKGNPFFTGLAYDLYDYEDEGTPGRGSGRCESVGIDDDALYVHMGMPEGVSQSAFYDQLFKNMQEGALPYPGYERQAREALFRDDFGKSFLSLEESESPIEPAFPEQVSRLAGQHRTMRLFLMDDDDPQGFAVVSTAFVASDTGEDLSVQITIDEAWCNYDDELVTDAWVMSIATSVSGALARAYWFRVANPHKVVSVTVLTESESHLTWSLAEGVCEVLPDVVGDSDARGLKHTSFNVIVCP